MGIFKKDELMLDFKGVQTEDMSSTIPYMKKLNVDAKMLVNQLNPNTNYNNKGLVLFNESEHYDMYKLFEKSVNLNNNDNNFSETSRFISSDVYNQLLTKLKEKRQTGGGKSRRSSRSSRSSKSRNEDKDDDFEEESSTTSSESSESDKKKKKQLKKLFKKNDDDEIDIEPDEEEEFSEMSAGSYLSSSAHTNGSNDSDNSNDSYLSASNQTSTVSVRNHRNRNMSDSVNTSDINIISLDH
jgi:hypothetical protein